VAKRPTIADIAKEAGVSIATVDRVLNRRLPVTEATVLRVVSSAEAIGFHAAGLLKQRIAEVQPRTFGFLLQKRNDEFYQALARELAHATKTARFIRGKPVVEFIDDLAPATIAARLREVGKRADALAIVAVDHPHVTQAIDELAAQGVPTFTLLTDLTAPARAGYIGLDSRKCGRTAAWTIARLARTPGKVAVLVGTHRYLNQETSEISFRSYFREHAQGFTLLETVVDHEDDTFAYDSIREILGTHPDLVGIYLAGGGMKGMIAALREHQGADHIIAVCNELLPDIRTALIDGIIDLVLGTPLPELARRAVEAMADAANGKLTESMRQVQLQPELFISENL
jgi:LacI family transcriptional regulator